jgi:DNA-binding MarR family transcriptional regulator
MENELAWRPGERQIFASSRATPTSQGAGKLTPWWGLVRVDASCKTLTPTPGTPCGRQGVGPLCYTGNMTAELEEAQLTAWRSFLTAHATLIDRIEHELVEANVLPLSWYDVLLALYEAPDHRLRMHELASAIVLSRSGLTRLVDRLEAEGLLYRERSGTDRRGAYAVLTDAGLAALRQTWPVYARGIAEHFACYLSDEEVRTLTEVFQRVLAAAREKMQL